jgi:hypothetical protein
VKIVLGGGEEARPTAGELLVATRAGRSQAFVGVVALPRGDAAQRGAGTEPGFARSVGLHSLLIDSVPGITC